MIRGITLWEPWATMVALGHKRIETRSWPANYSGPLLIHAAQRRPSGADVAEVSRALVAAGLRPLLDLWPRLGCVVAVARLVGSRPTSVTLGRPAAWVEALEGLERELGDYSPGRWGWSLEDVRRLDEPIPWRGMQGLWAVPPELEDRVNAALAAEGVPRGP